MTDNITLPRATVQQVLKTLEGIHRVDEYPELQPAVTALRAELEQQQAEPKCWCHKCNENRLVNNIPFSMTRMILCPTCGNKRCPKASDHRLGCTDSNASGQPGSAYPALPQQQAEPVSHAVIVGVLFDFMGWLTTRKERLVLSSTDNASPAADAIKDFAEMRGLLLDGAKVQDWQDYTTPPQRKPLTDELEAAFKEGWQSAKAAYGIREGT